MKGLECDRGLSFEKSGTLSPVVIMVTVMIAMRFSLFMPMVPPPPPVLVIIAIPATIVTIAMARAAIIIIADRLDGGCAARSLQCVSGHCNSSAGEPQAQRHSGAGGKQLNHSRPPWLMVGRSTALAQISSASARDARQGNCCACLTAALLASHSVGRTLKDAMSSIELRDSTDGEIIRSGETL
jgi:hypothetical protein